MAEQMQSWPCECKGYCELKIALPSDLVDTILNRDPFTIVVADKCPNGAQEGYVEVSPEVYQELTGAEKPEGYKIFEEKPPEAEAEEGAARRSSGRSSR